MRGFRGSRAAQSYNSRSDRHHERKMQKESFLRMVEQQAQPKAPPQLPAWLKGLEEQRRPMPVEAKVVPITRAKKRVAARPKAKPTSRKSPAKRKAA